MVTYDLKKLGIENQLVRGITGFIVSHANSNNIIQDAALSTVSVGASKFGLWVEKKMIAALEQLKDMDAAPYVSP